LIDIDDAKGSNFKALLRIRDDMKYPAPDDEPDRQRRTPEESVAWLKDYWEFTKPQIEAMIARFRQTFICSLP